MCPGYTKIKAGRIGIVTTCGLHMPPLLEELTLVDWMLLCLLFNTRSVVMSNTAQRRRPGFPML